MTTERKKTITISIMALAIVILIAMLLSQCNSKPKEKEYWENRGFKTDTVLVNIPYQLPTIDKKEKTIPPLAITQYQGRRSDYTWEISHLRDSILILIDSLNNSKEISLDFITQSPEAPKFLFGHFTRDSIKIDFLETNGDVVSYIWGTNFDRFNYHLTQKRAMVVKPLPKSKKMGINKTIQNSLFYNVGYDAFTNQALTTLEYNLHIWRFKLDVETGMYLHKNPNFMLQGSIGYRLLGK